MKKMIISLLLVVIGSISNVLAFEIEKEYKGTLLKGSFYTYEGKYIDYTPTQIYSNNEIGEIVGYVISDDDKIKLEAITKFVNGLFKEEKNIDKAMKLHSDLLAFNKKDGYEKLPKRVHFLVEYIVNEIHINHNKWKLSIELTKIDEMIGKEQNIKLKQEQVLVEKEEPVKDQIVPKYDGGSSTNINRVYYRGARGGCYYINSNGNKTYVEKYYCD